MKNKIFTLFTVTLLLLFSNSEKIFAQMFWNQACFFAGSNFSYIGIPNTSTNNITGSFTLEAWVNPNIYNGFSKGVICKGGPFGAAKIYGMRLQSTGRFDVWTNGTLRLTSNNSCPLNQWSHIAATYDAPSNSFALYFNGTIDNSAVIAGAAPVSSTDSLYIGIASFNTSFSGMIDEVRIWNSVRNGTLITQNKNLSLETNSGDYYSSLIMSIPFQKYNSIGTKFDLNDWSNHGNNGTAHGVSAVDLGNAPNKYLWPNQCLYLSAASEYLAGADSPAISPGSGVTLQAWIYPLDNSPAAIIHKGPPGGGAGTNYSLNFLDKKLVAKINGLTYDSQDTLPLDQWSHIAFTYWYDNLRRYFNFYVNGKNVKSGTLFGGSNITNGTDSLYIGGSSAMNGVFGYLDEVRISNYPMIRSAIVDSMYTPMENGTNANGTTASYSFDGSSWCTTAVGPFLYIRNTLRFSYPQASFNFPVSPLDKGYDLDLPSGFYMRTADRPIPATGSIGPMTDDTLNVLLDENIADINVFVALNHETISQLQISLIAPNGTVVQLMNSNSFLSPFRHLATVFDDQATTSIANNTYTTFGSTIRPLNNLNSALTGMNTKGLWRLAINDLSGFEFGRLYSWGIRFNNKSILPKLVSCKSLIQGFYNPVSNTMNRDTVRSYIRYTFFPYTILDSSITNLEPDGTGLYSFSSPDILEGINYFIQLKHRNSIETWSIAQGVDLDPLTSQASYDFTIDSSKAFGNNQIRVDNSPVKFAIFGGDVNQEGNINLQDIILIFNDATNFVTGYVNTDVTGDNVSNLSDILITYNNSNNFVVKITP